MNDQGLKGYVGGLNLDDGRLYSNNFTIGTSGEGTNLTLYDDEDEPVFSVDKGVTYIKNAEISELLSTSANIGGIQISDGELRYNTGIIMGSSSSGTTVTATISYGRISPMGEVVIFNLSERVADGIRIAYKYWDEGFWGIGAKWVYGTVEFTSSGNTSTEIIIPRVAMYNYRFVESDATTLNITIPGGDPAVRIDGELIINGKQLMFLADGSVQWQ